MLGVANTAAADVARPGERKERVAPGRVAHCKTISSAHLPQAPASVMGLGYLLGSHFVPAAATAGTPTARRRNKPILRIQETWTPTKLDMPKM